MSNPFAPIPAGSSVTKMSITAWNAFLDMHRWWLTHGLNSGAQKPAPTKRDMTIILVRNESGYSVPAFGILGLDVPLILPTDDPFQCGNHPAFKGVAPTVADHTGKWVAMLEPASDFTANPQCAISKAVLVGHAVVRVYVTATTDKFCDVSASHTVSGETVYLSTGGSGVPILWLDPALSAAQIGYAVVCCGVAPGNRSHWGTLDDALAYNDTTGVTVTLDIGGSVDNVLPPKGMTAGTFPDEAAVLVTYVDGDWYVTYCAECAA